MDLTTLSATEAVRRMRSGEISCERYARALLDRCQAAKELNAFIALEPEGVLADARARDLERRRRAPLGPLFGLPIPVKDSVNTRDYATTAGTPALRHFHPEEDAPIVQALRRAGAIVLGKTNLHELSFGWTSNNLAFGPVRNPYDRERIPGGSSGGTAAIIAAHGAPLGVAEDTQGSIRVPAALCGVAGFRPTTGRYSTEGCAPITPLFDQVGPHARSVADLALFDAAVTGDAARLAPPPLRGLRIGIVRDFWFEGLDPEVERVTARALEALRAAGVELIEAPLPGVQEIIDRSTDQVQNHDVRLALPRYLERYHAGVDFETLIASASPDIQAIFKDDVLPGGKDFVTEDVYAQATQHELPRLRALYRDYFARTGVAAMIFPTTRVPAPRIGEETTVEVRGASVPFESAVARNISPGSTAGIPGLVLPAGLTAGGLPVSLELDGPAGSDRALLSVGAALEPILGPMPAPPPGYRPASSRGSG
ncbi:MAG TPA: indoleacetamide hydrolase [Steroidobacteraceae bacterium]|nr:indoleacetamide hydrolase [Steroidobacteraceae bacterium]